jgi:orotidine-5'-phosphate decarboxylase
MADGHSHLIDFPEAIEVLLARVGDLKIVLRAAAAPGVDRIAETLRAGLAARKRGDVPATVQRISQAMQEVAALAAHADPAEAAAMRGRRSASAARSATPRRLPR